MKKKNSQEISGLLGVDTRFEGKIKFDGTIRVDGTVFGLIMSKSEKPSTVIITEMAVVEADIIADVVIISGIVSGNVKAVERLELCAPGRLEGLVYTSDFSIDNRALFQGECIMIRHLSYEDKAALKLEGFYDIHHRLVHQNHQTIQDLPQGANIIEI